MHKDVYEDDDGRAAPSNTEVFTIFHHDDEKGLQSLRDQLMIVIYCEYVGIFRDNRDVNVDGPLPTKVYPAW